MQYRLFVKSLAAATVAALMATLNAIPSYEWIEPQTDKQTDKTPPLTSYSGGIELDTALSSLYSDNRRFEFEKKIKPGECFELLGEYDGVPRPVINGFVVKRENTPEDMIKDPDMPGRLQFISLAFPEIKVHTPEDDIYLIIGLSYFGKPLSYTIFEVVKKSDEYIEAVYGPMNEFPGYVDRFGSFIDDEYYQKYYNQNYRNILEDLVFY